MSRKRPSATPQHRKPSIEALRALLVLAETESVSETARRLGVSQPVMTKKLQVFKDASACGAVLLRSTGKVALTESAQAVLPAIRELVSRYDCVIGYLRGKDTAPLVVRIATGGFAAEYFLPRAIATLRDLSDDCRFETRVCRGRDRIVGTATGAFDISIVTHEPEQICRILQEERIDESILTITPLAKHAMCLLADKHTSAGRELHSIPAAQSVPISKLSQWELVGPDSQSGIRKQLESRVSSGQLYFAAEGGGWAAAKEYARAGLGVAIVPRATIRPEDRKELVCRKLAQQFAISHYLIYRAESHSAIEEQVRAALIETAQRLAGGNR
jgi:DNA-binding transcriptional LysR family regulator